MREESSSSQNVNLYIASIAERGSTGEGFNIRLSEGSSFFVSRRFCDLHPLSLNQEIDDYLLDLLSREDDYVKALWKAGDLLSRAEQSSGGLYQKLVKKGYSKEASNQAVERVVQLGLLDDFRYAQLWLSNRLRQNPEGKSLLLPGLLSRGVKSEAAKRAINELDHETCFEALMKAGHKISKKYGDDDQKIKQALYRKGFSSSEIRVFFTHREI